MNSVNFKSVSLCSSLMLVLFSASVWAWEVDLSRRQVDFNRVSNQNRLPASVETSEKVGVLDKILSVAEPSQDIVILNTAKGFVPETLYLKKGATYRVHLVNVNENEKNISFILDAFSEHHNTVFGRTKTFTLSPKVEGVYDFLCPETSIQGRVVVAAPEGISAERVPASK